MNLNIIFIILSLFKAGSNINKFGDQVEEVKSNDISNFLKLKYPGYVYVPLITPEYLKFLKEFLQKNNSGRVKDDFSKLGPYPQGYVGFSRNNFYNIGDSKDLYLKLPNTLTLDPKQNKNNQEGIFIENDIVFNPEKSGFSYIPLHDKTTHGTTISSSKVKNIVDSKYAVPNVSYLVLEANSTDGEYNFVDEFSKNGKENNRSDVENILNGKTNEKDNKKKQQKINNEQNFNLQDKKTDLIKNETVDGSFQIGESEAIKDRQNNKLSVSRGPSKSNKNEINTVNSQKNSKCFKLVLVEHKKINKKPKDKKNKRKTKKSRIKNHKKFRKQCVAFKKRLKQKIKKGKCNVRKKNYQADRPVNFVFQDKNRGEKLKLNEYHGVLTKDHLNRLRITFNVSKSSHFINRN